MKCATEFTDATSVSHLGNKKLFMLLDVPLEEREEFISSSHEVNGKTKTIEEMTARELQQAIKEKKIDFSQWTANKFMKCATEFSNCGTFHNLEQSKLFALLDLPQEEREEFISGSHEVNGKTKTIEEMSTRELQQAIKEKKVDFSKRTATKFMKCVSELSNSPALSNLGQTKIFMFLYSRIDF